MTDIQKETIRYLRRNGQRYADIAVRLEVSESTVKTFCHRAGLTEAPERDTACRQCGAELHHRQGSKARKFCSDTCRLAWWRQHPYLLQRAAIYKIDCAHCGRTFESYGNKGRKYCSHGCYIRARYGKGADDHGIPAV